METRPYDVAIIGGGLRGQRLEPSYKRRGIAA